MKEFEVYDEMMADFDGQNANFLLPLNSWEFYGEHLANYSLFREDLTIIEKLSRKWDFSANYKEELLLKNRVIVVTNSDLKIVYATHNIEKMSGFSQDEVVGNSPKMFQGKNTSKETTTKVRNAIDNELPFEVTILNYRKDKTTYYCKIKGFPIKNKKGKLINYIAFEEAA